MISHLSRSSSIFLSIFFLDLERVEADAALGNSPLLFGEWSLATNFNATDEFLRKWADSQKRAYSESAGWIVRVSRSFALDADLDGFKLLCSFGASKLKIRSCQGILLDFGQ